MDVNGVIRRRRKNVSQYNYANGVGAPARRLLRPPFGRIQSKRVYTMNLNEKIETTKHLWGVRA